MELRDGKEMEVLCTICPGNLSFSMLLLEEQERVMYDQKDFLLL
jgi:hypothetical protein